jgi:superoxide reductase
MRIGDISQTADWKAEKHVPVIEAPDKVKAGESFKVTVAVGKEIAHPNTTEHHIRWIKLYFKPENGKFAYDLGSFEFAAHGEAVEGPNKGPVFTEPQVNVNLKISSAGTLLATAYCNIHGLWEFSKDLAVE